MSKILEISLTVDLNDPELGVEVSYDDSFLSSRENILVMVGLLGQISSIDYTDKIIENLENTSHLSSNPENIQNVIKYLKRFNKQRRMLSAEPVIRPTQVFGGK